MLNMMKDVGGVEMPEFFGKLLGDEPRDRPINGEPAEAAKNKADRQPPKSDRQPPKVAGE